MAPLVIVVLIYIGIGVGLIMLSMWLTKRIPFLALRIACHTAVFTFWFMPGFVASEGGAMPAPVWLIVVTAKQSDHLDVAKAAGACWGGAWIVTLGVAGIFRWLQKKDASDGIHSRLP